MGMNNANSSNSSSSDKMTILSSERSQIMDPYRMWPPVTNTILDHPSYDWRDYLSDANFVAAPVENFGHVPLAETFSQLNDGLKFEVPNRDYWEEASSIGGVYWMASVVKFAGYKMLLRYEGCGEESSNDFWMNLGSADVHPIGWCAKEAKPLVPPKVLTDKIAAVSDWKTFLVKRLTGSKTIPVDFQEKLVQNITAKLRIGHVLEAVDRNRPGRYRPARVVRVVGERVCVEYTLCDADFAPSNNGVKRKAIGSGAKRQLTYPNLWCHVQSTFIRPFGWCSNVRAPLHCDDDFLRVYKHKLQTFSYDADDATADYFPKFRESHFDDEASHSPHCKKLRLHQSICTTINFEEHMKLEAIDVYNNYYTITPATVTRVFSKWNCIEITYDGTCDSLIVDDLSPYIYPIGYCEAFGVQISAPEGYSKEFDWPTYLQDTDSVGAPAMLFKQVSVNNFKVNQKVEATDHVDPHLVCVATIVQVAGRLLRVHYDGWTDEYDQWFDVSSPELYPVGWCELTGHPLEKPYDDDELTTASPPPPDDPSFNQCNTMQRPVNGEAMNKKSKQQRLRSATRKAKK